MARTEKSLKALIEREIDAALGFLGSELTDQRKTALEYYLGEPFGNEIEGRSKVVMTDVADTVEWILPSLMDIFTSSDEVAKFEPTGPEDEEAAKQATQYVNWIFYQDNPGFLILYTMFKDALIQKNGMVKIGVEKKTEDTIYTVSDVEPDAYMVALSDPDIEIIGEPEAGESGLSYRYKKKPVERVCVENIPPEEFLISREAKSIGKARFVGHRTPKTVSELIELGFDRKKVEAINSDEDADWTVEATTRRSFDDVSGPDDITDGSDATRRVWITEAYMRYDWDDDGIAEMRKIVCAGKGGTILLNEEWDGPPPFVSVTPIIMPHRFFGMSVADTIMDLQLIKSTVMRQILDNMYLANNSRHQISDQVNLDDMLTSRPGGIVRLRNGAMPSQGHIMPIETRLMVGQSFPVMEYLDAVKENRTGVTRYNQGTDANSLNKTASGIGRIMTAAQQRIKLIAKIMAETGVKDMMMMILKTAAKSESRARQIRMHGAWQTIDPRGWENKFDLTVDVGLGTGDREQMVAKLTNLLGIQLQGLQMQGSAQGPIVTLQNIYSTLSRLTEATGQKNVAAFFTDPSKNPMPPQQPKPDPEMAKVQAQAEADKARLQLQAQTDQQKMQLQAISETEKLKLQREIAIAELQLEREKAAMEAQQQARQCEVDIGLKTDKQNQEMALKRDVAESKAQPAMALHLDGKEVGQMADGLGQLVTQIAQNQQEFMRMQAERDARQDQMMAAILQNMAGPKTIEGVLPSGQKFSAVTRPVGNA